MEQRVNTLTIFNVEPSVVRDFRAFARDRNIKRLNDALRLLLELNDFVRLNLVLMDRVDCLERELESLKEHPQEDSGLMTFGGLMKDG